MDQFSAMKAFRSIVDAGSFTAAAERMETTHSSMSRQLRQLEAHLGSRLLDRNSRRLTLTEAGRAYYQDCVDILDRLEVAEQRLQADHDAPSGLLRVSAPLVIGTLELSQWLPSFLEQYPGIELDLSCDDRLVDLIGGGFDMALRIAGPLADSTLVARELAVTDMVWVASPRYIAQWGLPRQPSDLARHALIGFAGARALSAWTLTSARGTQVEVIPQGRLRVDAIPALHAAVLAGQGIAAFTRLTVQDDLLHGRLVRVLPQHHAGRRHYYAVYPHARQLAPKVRALAGFMARHYAALQQLRPVIPET